MPLYIIAAVITGDATFARRIQARFARGKYSLAIEAINRTTLSKCF